MRLRLASLLFLSLAAPAAVSAATPATLQNSVAAENSRPGSVGWDVPRDSGGVITGYASQTSVAPGESVELHVSAPAGSSYRVLVYRLGWYHGLGGRLLTCLPGCGSSELAQPQAPPTAPAPDSHLFFAPWTVTDRLTIPRDAASGYYEAKLEVVSGSGAGALGSVPFIVRERAPRAAVLIQVPVNTWQAYNRWGGQSLYGKDSTHASEVSFDRPYDAQVFHDMATELELPWVRFLERTGVDVAYQTDADTDRDPKSLLQHRLVFSIGHDEYWTQRMRDAFERAKSLSTNLMFGSNSDLWRMRYADSGRTIVEWRDPRADPIHTGPYATGEFRQFGQPECRLMAVQYLYYAHRGLTAAATPYTVVGAATDPWLSAAGLKPGDVVPGVVGYEWDSLIPSCFKGQVVPLMHAIEPGTDGVLRSADMVRATAPSGARVFAMGTMELGWALDDFAGQAPDRRVQAFVGAALRDLTRPAPPARLRFRRVGKTLIISARLRRQDPRVLRVSVRLLGTGQRCADALHNVCRLRAPRHHAARSYVAVAIDQWGRSQPLVVRGR